MTSAANRVLQRLAEIGFTSRSGPVTPFGETLPLVVGAAWDRRTAQVAFVAEGPADEDVWRQLLFAVSGLRRHLHDDAPPALGAPIILAVVDEETERQLRQLAEELAEYYALFSRIDLNLVAAARVDEADYLDLVLAPLLPACRGSIGRTIAREDLNQFWDSLRGEVRAVQLDPIFDGVRDEVAEEVAELLVARRDAEAPELPSPTPIDCVELEHFRSFERASLELPSVTIVHGGNGSGKSSILEALELLWAGTTGRRPAGVRAKEYEKHLPRRGVGSFVVRGRFRSGTERTVGEIAEEPTGDLPRSVLTQETVAELVNSAPKERITALLGVTGLEVPELAPWTMELLQQARGRADRALAQAGLPPLKSANSNGADHLKGQFESGFVRAAPDWRLLAETEDALAHAAGGTYQPHDWSAHADIVERLADADAAVNAVGTALASPPDPSPALVDASKAMLVRAREARERQAAVRALVNALAAVPSGALEPQPPPVQAAPQPVPRHLAARWLAHTESLTRASRDFRSEAEGLEDASWAAELTNYAEALNKAAMQTPRTELERFARAPDATAPVSAARPSKDVFLAAGFTRAPARPEGLREHISALHSQLQRHADTLERVANDLERHPAAAFALRTKPVLQSLCRFELARRLRRPGSPIDKASEELVVQLLQGRLYPVVRELVAAMVRFEWYFEPIQITVEKQQVLIGGLATPRGDLDVRMLLNSAERTVVGLGWFLALYLLQPTERRRVLVLDDAAGAFDPANQAGFVSTLRAFVRLVRPEQLVLATHDDTLAQLLEEELTPVDGWPTEVRRLLCRRDRDDASVAELAAPVPHPPSDLAQEELTLGLGGEALHA